MYSLKNKIIFITGASSGIGEACAKQFAALGANIILSARRADKLKQLASVLIQEHGVSVLPLELDVTDKIQVQAAIDGLSNEWKDIAVLVNSAGLALDTLKLQEGDVNNWETMIDTNIKGLLYVTRAIVPGMIDRQCGHIINLGSMAGHDHYQTGNVYSATKHAVRALSKSLRIDLLGTGLRVTDIAPGAVETEFSIVRWKDKKRADDFYKDFTPLVADDIADAIVYCATRPLHLDISELVIMPTDQASANHLHKPGQVVKGMFD
jgi:3-hydroxy acid dehydrogenase/malonic semialdehyde reductase